VLDKIGEIFRGIDNFIRIEGHTDSSPITVSSRGESYETNWELSSARSINVLRYFVEEDAVNPKQVSAVAFGQYRPIDDNSIPEGRAYNRRVDIVVLTERGLEESKDKNINRPLPDEEWR
jgi:chemotaxis protein MotB